MPLKHRLPTALGASLVLLFALLALPGMAAQDGAASARSAAADWLVDAYEVGDITGPGGLTDLILALVSADVDDADVDQTVQAARDELELLVLDGQGDASVPLVGELAKSALGVLVGGGDPDDIDGTSLLIPLRGLILADGADAGRFDDAGPFIQSLGVFALATTDEGVPPSTLRWLADQACLDGGFNFGVSNDGQGVSQGCPEVIGSEPDATALAVQAMIDVEAVATEREAAVQWLLDRQQDDGSFADNANSTGLAGQALLAAGETAAAERAQAFVLTLQNDPDVEDAGAIRFTAENDGSLFLATTQGMLGLGAPSFLDLAAGPMPMPSPTPSSTPSPTPSPTAGVVERVAGDTRLATAIAASRAGFPDGAARGAVIARADSFADALAGTPLAAWIGGPLLITGPDALATDVAAELQRVLADDGTVTLLGGGAALSDQVITDIESLGLEVQRIAGDTRITTAIAVAEELALANDIAAVLITTGFDFPDALTAGTAAAAAGDAAVLLTNDGTRSAELDVFLEESAATMYAIGGPAVRAYPEAIPLAGASREGTALAVASEFFTNPSTVALARRDGFADALAGGVLAASRGAPLLLTDSAVLSAENRTYVCATDSVTSGLLLGGENAVADSVAEQLAAAIAGEGCN